MTIPPHVTLYFVKTHQEERMQILSSCNHECWCIFTIQDSLFFNLAQELCTWNLCRMWGCWGLLPLLAINWGLVLVGHTSLWRGNSSHFLAIENQEAIIDKTVQMVRTGKPVTVFSSLTIKTWSSRCHCENLPHQKIQGDIRISRKCTQPVTQLCLKLKRGQGNSEIKCFFFFFLIVKVFTSLWSHFNSTHSHFTVSHISVSTIYPSMSKAGRL